MSARAGKKSLLIVREKVLLHILSYHKYLQDPDAPASATQEGIADAVSVGRNNISKIVNALAKEGLVEVQTKHVKGFATVKRVYFLLPKGFEAALELKKEIESVPVGIIDFDGKVHRDVVGKIGVYLPKRYTFLEMVTGVHQGKFDCASFHEGKAKEERRFIDYTDRKPAVRTFYGRSEELDRLSRFLDSDTAHIMAVCGIPGIGKTSLIAKFVQDVREQRNLFWYRIHEWVTLKILLAPFAEFLSQLGRKGLESYLSRTEVPQVGEISVLLESELKDLSAVVILDDVQKADPPVQAFLAALVVVLENLPQVHMICTSREIPSFYTRSAVFKGTVLELMLEGLDKESSYRLLRNRNLPEGGFNDIFLATKGHPLFLELIDAPKSALGKNVRMFIEQEVLSKLDLTERRILEIASIFRYPVLIEAFFTMEEEIAKEMDDPPKELGYHEYLVDYDTMDSLLGKSLMNESVGRMVGMHDLLRDFFYSRLTPRQRTSYHRAACRYYLQDSSASAHVEAMYHSLKAKEYDMAVRIAASNGRDIIAKGYGLPFAPLLSELQAEATDMGKSEKIEILLLDGEVLDVRGEWDQAIARFKEVGELADPSTDGRVLAEIAWRVGLIHLRRSKFDDAEACFDRSLKLATTIGNQHILVNAHYGIGGIMQDHGRSQEALASYNRSFDIARSIGDDAGMGRAMYGIGRIYTNMMDHHKALKAKKAALEAVERTGDVDEITKVCIGIGVTLGDMLNHAEAVNYLERAVKVGRMSGNMFLQGYATRNLASSLIELGDLSHAEEMLDPVADVFKKLGNPHLVADVHLMRGYIHSRKRDWECAKEEFNVALDIVRPMSMPLVLGRWLFEISQEYINNGDREGAGHLLTEALKVSSDGAADNLRKEVEGALERITA